MILEFLKDSEELKQFVDSCELIDRVDTGDDGYDDRQYFLRIYRTPSGKMYSVECVLYSGVKTKTQFLSYKRNFKSDQPSVVKFIEVKPVEVTIIEWRDVE